MTAIPTVPAITVRYLGTSPGTCRATRRLRVSEAVQAVSRAVNAWLYSQG